MIRYVTGEQVKRMLDRRNKRDVAMNAHRVESVERSKLLGLNRKQRTAIFG